MRIKRELPKNAAFAPFYEAAIAFCGEWPDPKDLKNIGVTLDATGWPIVGSPDTFPTLLRAALEPAQLRQDTGDAEFRRFFAVLYARSPDFVLALLLRLRQMERRASPIRKYFRKATTNLCDKEIAAIIGATEADTVKAERQKLTKSATGLSTKHDRATEAHEKMLSDNLSKPAPWRKIPTRAKGTKPKNNSL